MKPRPPRPTSRPSAITWRGFDRMKTGKKLMIDAEPYPFAFRPAAAALLIIDMQRDFLEPGGFGEMLGNDVSQLRQSIEPNKKLLAKWRGQGLPVIHTR